MSYELSSDFCERVKVVSLHNLGIHSLEVKEMYKLMIYSTTHYVLKQKYKGKICSGEAKIS